MQEFSEEMAVMQRVQFVLKRVNVMIGVLVFAGIGFLILFGVCLCLLRAGSEEDDRMRELFEEREGR